MTKGSTIVIIEQEYRLRLHFKVVFKSVGYEVIGESRSYDAALSLVCEKKPDAVFFHLSEEKESLIVLGQIARLAPVIAFGDLNIELAVKGAHAGAYACLREEAPAEELISAIELGILRFAEKSRLAKECEELKDLLALRKILDKAKGILMTKYQMSEQEAHRRIQRYAMHKRLTVKSVAEAIIKATGGKSA